MFNRLGNAGTTTTAAAAAAAPAAEAPAHVASASSAATPTSDLYLRPLPYLDAKWLRADLITCLRNAADGAVLWNHLIQDCELVSSPTAPLRNAHGQLSYLGDDGKHYCGAEALQCTCCQPEYCGPLSACNCDGCRPLDSDTAIKKLTSAAAQQALGGQQHATELTLSAWLWSQPPNQLAKHDCQRTLIAELHELALRAAGNCLSAQQLRQQLFIYERYFVALKRNQQQQPAQPQHQQPQASQQQQLEESLVPAPPLPPEQEPEHAALGLARVGTRAALNFSFAFLRRAWRSGEDMEMCSELLSEALESLQELPEATLFDAAAQVSPLWLEVMERSIKFLRLVALGDPMGGRCLAPLTDRHTALCLLLELGVQKGTLAATLECVVLLLVLWEKDNDNGHAHGHGHGGVNGDNRDMPRKSGAPLLRILQRYQRLGADPATGSNSSSGSGASANVEPATPLASATETFLRFLMLPKSSAAIVDLRRAAVVIISHLDRLVQPHMPHPTQLLPSCLLRPAATPNTASTILEQQRVYALGWPALSKEQQGFNVEPALSWTSAATQQPPPALLTCKFQLKQVACSEDMVVLLCQEGKLYNWPIAKPETEPQLMDFAEIANETFVSIAAHCEGRHFLAVDSNRESSSSYSSISSPNLSLFSLTLSTADNAYSWGVGDSRRLGHGDCHARELPTKIESLVRRVQSVYCGCSYSAAITLRGNLYTWGRGTYGRLGHGNSDDQCMPAMVMALKDHQVLDVALGSGDAHTLCLTRGGLVYAWGDGDYGKLGNGSCNSSLQPLLIECLPRVQRVFAGSQFSLALTCEGQLYSWGKASCLGHQLVERNVQGCSVPRLITSLQVRDHHYHLFIFHSTSTYSHSLSEPYLPS